MPEINSTLLHLTLAHLKTSGLRVSSWFQYERDMSRYWSKAVRELEPYTPGEQPQDQQCIKLNTNENPYPPSPKVIHAIKQAANENIQAKHLYEALKNQGIFVRYFQKPGVQNHLRVSIGTDTQMQILIEKLRELIRS